MIEEKLTNTQSLFGLSQYTGALQERGGQRERRGGGRRGGVIGYKVIGTKQQGMGPYRAGHT